MGEKMIKLNLRLPEDLHAALTEIAKAENRSLNAQMITALQYYTDMLKRRTAFEEMSQRAQDVVMKRYSPDELRAKQKQGESQTNLAMIDSLSEAQIEQLADQDDADLGIDGWDLESADKQPTEKLDKAIQQAINGELKSYDTIEDMIADRRKSV